MRPKGTPAELERRRRRAVRLLEGGQSLATVAQRVGAAVSAVWQWRDTFRRRGAAGLAAKPASGRPVETDGAAAPTLAAAARARGPRPWLCHRPVDNQAGGGDDRARIRRGVSPGARQSAAGGVR